VKQELLPQSIRLNKFISHAGVCARRAADTLIQAGHITVNGKKVNTLGYKVTPQDVVKYRDQVLKEDKHIYILLNKPKDYITTTQDPKERKTVLQLVKNACQERVYPVGRLDRNTTGLLLLTNDGALAKKLAHPSSNLAKLYHVMLNKPLSKEDYEKIKVGVVLEDGIAHVDQLEIVEQDSRSIGLKIHMGRNRVVRRIFEHLHYDVVKLDRVMYAHLTKKDLPRGKWRLLTQQEVNRLNHLH
jgi:23S rRNA pseudouridine2605 synthase